MNTTVPFTTAVRACLGCGEPLEKYHRGDYCKTCGGSKADDLDAELDRAATERKAVPVARPAVPAGCSLTPVAALPGRRLESWARELIEAFLASDADIAKVTTPNRVANNVQTHLSKTIRMTPHLRGRVYACSRKGDCYLVRMKKGGDVK